jgi:succinate-semialdehyde dehydrogenase/glutarate-semialdehyde dehydrogenase
MEGFFGPAALFFHVIEGVGAFILPNELLFGLGRSALTKGTARGEQVDQQIDTGMVFVKTTVIALPDLPVGGVKNSGYGRELSAAGIHEFAERS